MSPALEVLAPGLLTVVEDEGRPGLARYGVAPSGAADREAYRAANDLVGNAPGLAALETLGGLRLRSRGDTWVAVTGAAVPLLVDGAPRLLGTRVRLADGQVLETGMPDRGLRAYVAVRGGLDVAPVLGSRSRDVLAALGPETIAVGDVLPVGPVEDVPWAPREHRRSTVRDGAVVLDAVPGPRADRVPAAAALFEGEWGATTAATRVALRLERVEGPGLAWDAAVEHPSEGVVRGSVQVPPSGLPVVLLADHPLTGGYPVVAVLTDVACDLAAQVRPGQRVRFAAVPPPWTTSR